MSSIAAVTIVQISLLGAHPFDDERAYQRSVSTPRPPIALVGAKSIEEVHPSVTADASHAGQSARPGSTPKETPAHDYTAAYHRSLATGRPLVVLVGADWCPACVLMKKKILPQVAKTGGLANVEFAYVDLDRERALASRLAGDGPIPLLIQFDRPNSPNSRRMLVGAKSPRKVASFIRQGLCPEAAPQRPVTVPSQHAEPATPPVRRTLERVGDSIGTHFRTGRAFIFGKGRNQQR